MSEWKTYKLGELPILFIDGDRGKNYPKGDDFSEVGHCLFLNAGNVTKNGWNFDGNVYISEEKDNLLRNGKLERGDIVLTTRGTVGNVVLYSDDIPYKHIRINSGMVIIRNNNTCYNPYLYQYLRSYSFFKQVQQFQSGSAQPQIPISTLKKLTISLPPLAEQKRIADILSAIDDKIELNRRINTNLEQQAQALYKSWFVDADTTGWGTKKLADFFNVITGKKDANYSTKDGVYPFFTCSQDILKAPNYSFEGAAILLAGNGDFNVKRYIGKFEAYQRTYVLIPFEKRYHSFLYLLIKYHLQEITGGSRGSVIKFITKGNIADFTFTMPPYSIDEKLSLFDSLFNEIDKNITEINNLSTLRDTLLPKLMSGEIKV